MNNPLKSQIAANRERFIKERADAISEMFDNKYADGIYPTSVFFERIDKQNDTSQISLLQTAIDAVEGMKNISHICDYNCADEPHGIINEALSEVVDLLKGGIE